DVERELDDNVPAVGPELACEPFDQGGVAAVDEPVRQATLPSQVQRLGDPETAADPSEAGDRDPLEEPALDERHALLVDAREGCDVDLTKPEGAPDRCHEPART